MKNFLIGLAVGALITAAGFLFYPSPPPDSTATDQYLAERDSIRLVWEMEAAAYQQTIDSLSIINKRVDTVYAATANTMKHEINLVDNIDDIDSLRQIIRANFQY